MTVTPEVQPGQVWESCDRRDNGRQVEVLDVVFELGGVTLANPYAVVQSPTGRGRQTRIRLDRFRPTSSGYRLVREAQG